MPPSAPQAEWQRASERQQSERDHQAAKLRPAYEQHIHAVTALEQDMWPRWADNQCADRGTR